MGMQALLRPDESRMKVAPGSMRVIATAIRPGGHSRCPTKPQIGTYRPRVATRQDRMLLRDAYFRKADYRVVKNFRVNQATPVAPGGPAAPTGSMRPRGAQVGVVR